MPLEKNIKTPVIYKSVRAVGTFRPKFGPRDGKIFADELNVIGTAFWLKKHKLLVTCSHVVQGLINAPLELTGLLVVGNSGNYKRAIIDGIDLKHDLATLRLVDNNGNTLAGENLENEASDGLDFVTDYPVVSSEVSYAGFPLGNQLLDQLHSPTYSEGVIGIQKRGDNTKKEIQISGAVVGGFSGSPVVLKGTNKLIGVLSNGPQSSPNIFMAVSWEHVKALAELANS